MQCCHLLEAIYHDISHLITVLFLFYLHSCNTVEEKNGYVVYLHWKKKEVLEYKILLSFKDTILTSVLFVRLMGFDSEPVVC